MMSHELYNKVTKKDVKHALDYIVERGKPYRYGILHIDGNDKYRAKNRFVHYNGKRIATRQAVRLALFRNLGGQLYFSELPAEWDVVEEIRKIGEQRGFSFTGGDMPRPNAKAFLIDKMGLKKEDFVSIDASGRETVIGGKYADEDDESADNAVREYEKQGAEDPYEIINEEDVRRAFDYILQNGKPHKKNGILHVDSNKMARAFKRCVQYKGEKLAPKEIIRVALLLHFREELTGDLDFIRMIPEVGKRNGLVLRDNDIKGGFSIAYLRRLPWLAKEDFLKVDTEGRGRDTGGGYAGESGESNGESTPDGAYGLLKQFKQIIFEGPPGTGKTHRAKGLLPDLLDGDREEIEALQGKRWDIVQFHPSYNYEDFVRGVKVETTESGAVAYKTENRAFGEMCERAANDSENDYALIIDEINRANVSAVLGELIYALEYRGQKIKMPYRVGGSDMLFVPENLYIIGTMNTADRTIGQIDYAVRRRFAFVHCPPDGAVVPVGEAGNMFREVNEIFERHISPDYNADDVRIGHSYFLANGGELARKVTYQVIPILREYVKDGVLSQDAEEEILELERQASELSGGGAGLPSDGAENADGAKKRKNWYWKIDSEKEQGPMPLNRVALEICRHYAKAHPGITIEEFREWLPDPRHAGLKISAVKLFSKIDMNDPNDVGRFFTKEDERLTINGEVYCITNDWGRQSRTIPWEISFDKFAKEVEKSGYTVREEDRE